MGEDVTEWMFDYETESGDEDEDESEEDSEDDSEDDEEGVHANWHKLKEVRTLERY